MNILITGGAGFVGSNLALSFRAAYPNAKITTFDNLKRRGSELNLPRLKKQNIDFVHGDIRVPSDLNNLTGRYDVFIEASAEPSVLAGYSPQISADYALQSNLTGTTHCLEWARSKVGALIFLSTSRVYSLNALKKLPLVETPSRLDLSPDHGLFPNGITTNGLDETFSTAGARSLYGTTKLASELLVEEYAGTFGVPALINRCGVICGPGQMGKVDQGVFTLWVAKHAYADDKKNTGLKYTGFGGKGHQVRDLLHPNDLFALIQKQLQKPALFDGRAYNVGGGATNSVSLAELTALCQNTTGREISIGTNPESSPVDVPWYVSNNARATKDFGWAPTLDKEHIVKDIFDWLRAEETALKPLFC